MEELVLEKPQILNVKKINKMSDKATEVIQGELDCIVDEDGVLSAQVDLGNYSKRNRLTTNNNERLCFAIGPGKLIKNSPILEVEYKIGQNFADLAYVVPSKDKPKCVAIFENKMLNVSLDDTFKEATRQIYHQYLTPLKEEGGRFLNLDVNLCLAISVFEEDVYFSDINNFRNYLNDASSTPSERIEKYGYVSLVCYLNTNSINSLEDLEILFKSALSEKTLPQNFSFVIPKDYTFEGEIESLGSDCQYIKQKMLVKNLESIPICNHNAFSELNNTRDLNENKNKKEIEIFKTAVNRYWEYKCSNPPISIGESYVSFGTNAREVTYVNKSTITIADNNKIRFITSDFSLTNGQHSTRAYIQILNNIKCSKVELSIKYQRIIKKYFGSLENFDLSEFIIFLENCPLDINIKGFSKPSLASSASKNLNNIENQSSSSKLNFEARSIILNVVNYYNSRNGKLKLAHLKSSYKNKDLMRKEERLIDFMMLVSVVPFISESFHEIFKECFDDRVNKIIGTQSSITTTNQANFNKSMNELMLRDEYLDGVKKLFLDLTSKIDSEDYISQEVWSDLLDDLQKDVFKIVWGHKSENAQKAFGVAVSLNIEGKKTQISDLNDCLYLINEKINEIEKLSLLNTKLLDKLVFMLPLYFDEYVNIEKTKNFDFLRKNKSEDSLMGYFFNIVNTNLYIKIRNVKGNFNFNILDEINESMIKETLTESIKRIEQTNEYVNKNPSIIKSINIGSNQKDINPIIKSLLFIPIV